MSLSDAKNKEKPEVRIPKRRLEEGAEHHNNQSLFGRDRPKMIQQLELSPRT